MSSSTKRGQEFEAEVAKLLRAVGFRVTINARAARPRQTDIYAQAEGIDLLVEVKNRRRKVDVSDVDSLRSRLGRTTADVVGAIFTTSELTEQAVKAIEIDRTREVLAFVGKEIEVLRSGHQNLMSLIVRKRDELRVQGKAWFGPLSRSEFAGVKLPRGNVEFLFGGKARSYFESRTTWAHASYTLHIPDPGWGNFGGEGALLRMRLALHSTSDLRNIMGYLHEKFGLSNRGMFSVHQSDTCWHGVGAENFIQAVSEWRARYNQGGLKSVHHSEELMYFDDLRAGWVLLSSQQRVFLTGDRTRPESFLHSTELAIQLPGVPINMAPFLDLCRYTGNDWAEFEYVPQRFTHRRRLKRPIVLDVVGEVVSIPASSETEAKRERVVTGVIARNPFFRKRQLPRQLRESDEMSSLHDLLSIELILCTLTDWHDEGDVIDRYLLKGFEVTHANTAQLIQPFGTWNDIVRRSRVWRRKDSNSELQKMIDGLSGDDSAT